MTAALWFDRLKWRPGSTQRIAFFNSLDRLCDSKRRTWVGGGVHRLPHPTDQLALLIDRGGLSEEERQSAEVMATPTA